MEPSGLRHMPHTLSEEPLTSACSNSTLWRHELVVEADRGALRKTGAEEIQMASSLSNRPRRRLNSGWFLKRGSPGREAHFTGVLGEHGIVPLVHLLELEDGAVVHWREPRDLLLSRSMRISPTAPSSRNSRRHSPWRVRCSRAQLVGFLESVAESSIVWQLSCLAAAA